MTTAAHEKPKRPVRIPVSRRAGWLRGPVAAPAGAVICIVVYLAWQPLRFDPNPASNRLTDYALAVVYAAVGLIGIGLLWYGLKWLIFALWPGPVELVADEGGLTVPTGPFAVHRYDWERMTARYSFEVEPDEEGFAFDSLMDEDEEPDARLPLLQHPESRIPLNVALERLIDVRSPVHIARLRPWIDAVRRRQQDAEERE